MPLTWDNYTRNMGVTVSREIRFAIEVRKEDGSWEEIDGDEVWTSTKGGPDPTDRLWKEANLQAIDFIRMYPEFDWRVMEYARVITVREPYHPLLLRKAALNGGATNLSTRKNDGLYS